MRTRLAGKHGTRWSVIKLLAKRLSTVLTWLVQYYICSGDGHLAALERTKPHTSNALGQTMHVASHMFCCCRFFFKYIAQYHMTHLCLEDDGGPKATIWRANSTRKWTLSYKYKKCITRDEAEAARRKCDLIVMCG